MWVICLYCSTWQVLEGYRKRVYYCLRWWESILKNKYSTWAGRGNCLINYLVILSGSHFLVFWNAGQAARAALRVAGAAALQAECTLFTLRVCSTPWASTLGGFGAAQCDRPLLSAEAHARRDQASLSQWAPLPCSGARVVPDSVPTPSGRSPTNPE